LYMAYNESFNDDQFSFNMNSSINYCGGGLMGQLNLRACNGGVLPHLVKQQTPT
jgi:hypothetical protein